MRPEATLTPGPYFEYVPNGWQAAWDAGHTAGYHLGPVGAMLPPGWLEGLEVEAYAKGFRQGVHAKADE